MEEDNFYNFEEDLSFEEWDQYEESLSKSQKVFGTLLGIMIIGLVVYGIVDMYRAVFP